MIRFRQGHRGPKAVMTQILLNTYPPQARLLVDGVFGQLSSNALRQFQASTSVHQSGQMDDATWQALARVASLQVIEVIDLDDLIVESHAHPDAGLRDLVRDGHLYGLVAAGELSRAGSRNMIVNVGMSNSVVEMVSQVQQRAPNGRIALLRIFAHGNSGLQILSAGHGVTGGSESHGAALTARSVRYFADQLSRLRPLFMPYGSAELHGCRVGSSASGRQLLQELADVWGVPVTAGIQTQQVGRSQTFAFEGPVVTAYPGASGSLRTWATQVEQRSAMSHA